MSASTMTSATARRCVPVERRLALRDTRVVMGGFHGRLPFVRCVTCEKQMTHMCLVPPSGRGQHRFVDQFDLTRAPRFGEERFAD